MEINDEISYSQLEEWFDELTNTDPNAEWNEYGPDGKIESGHNFIVIVSTVTYSFVLCGYIISGDNKGSQWKLIYKE